MYFTPTYKINICPDAEYMDFIENVTDQIESLGTSGVFESYDNKNIFYRYVLAKDAKASVVILHGYTEFVQKYYETAWYLLNSGYNVYLFDMRGHGLSDRETEEKHFAHINSFDDYVKDLESFIDQIVIPTSDGKPLYAFSHSMGGAVVLCYMCDHPDVFEKSVFCSPMIDPHTKGAPRWVTVHHVMSKGKEVGWDKKFTFSGNWNPNPDFKKSVDKSYNRFISNLNIRRADWHYQNSCSTFAWMREVMAIRDKLMNKEVIGKINSKVLIMSAGHDYMVKLAAEKKFSKLLKDCEYYCFKDAKHTIYTGTDENITLFYKKMLAHFKN
ncbi:MAG: alpha/beta hydrolase [Clostridia bacterium]|nr:alpha/beta hydrolase [Clostridia bacterium]